MAAGADNDVVVDDVVVDNAAGAYDVSYVIVAGGV